MTLRNTGNSSDFIFEELMQLTYVNGPEAFKTELKHLEFLFELYCKYTKPMDVAMEEEPK